MTTIYKYPLTITDQQTVVMPKSARLLSVAVVRGEVVMYAVVDTANAPVPRTIWIHGTGLEIPVHHESASGSQFIGTVILQDGALVFHMFGAL